NGSIANGSRRSWPISPSAAAVFSDAMHAPRKTPCCQDRASTTSGAAVARRPPNKIAEIGTPAGSSHSGAIDGHCAAGTVNRALGWAAGSPEPGVQSRPRQSVRYGGGSGGWASHPTSPPPGGARRVWSVARGSTCAARGWGGGAGAGAAQKPRAGGLTARGPRPGPTHTREMPSQRLSPRQPRIAGTIRASLVFPHPDGNAAAIYGGPVPPLPG